MYKDYEVTGQFNKYIIGAKVLDCFEASKPSAPDRQLILIFEKENNNGFIIYGFNELGSWIEYLKFANKVIYEGSIFENDNLVKSDIH